VGVIKKIEKMKQHYPGEFCPSCFNGFPAYVLHADIFAKIFFCGNPVCFFIAPLLVKDKQLLFPEKIAAAVMVVL
jgi:hypothetical protein